MYPSPGGNQTSRKCEGQQAAVRIVQPMPLALDALCSSKQPDKPKMKPFIVLTLGLSISVTAGLAAEQTAGASLRPCPPQYKLKPEETQRLTPADVVGPDGVVYPNWTRCGVQGGIPEVKVFDRIENYGAKADDDQEGERT